MKKYILKGTKKGYGQIRPKDETGYVEKYWYFGMEEYSTALTNYIDKAQIFHSLKEAESAKSLLEWSSNTKQIKIISIKLDITILK